MCGIVGVIGKKEAVPALLGALNRLAYRGYDSAGVATLVNGKIDRRRAAGKLTNLEALLQKEPLGGTTGIGHTRWATHGPATVSNAHPHATERVAVIHNGIIENHAELRKELEALGQIFDSQTDTEVIVRLLDYHLQNGKTPLQAAKETLSRLRGAYALAFLFAGHPDFLIGAAHGAPLAVGYGEDGLYLGSDAIALTLFTQKISYLSDGDFVVLDKGTATFFDDKQRPVTRPVCISHVGASAVGKGNYRHFMEKELHEQPGVISNVLQRLTSPSHEEITLPDLSFSLKNTDFISFCACGSAYYAGCVAGYWIEQIAGIPVTADTAGEFRYREPPLPPHTLGIFISQSGETADTLAALRHLKNRHIPILSVLNSPESTMARESHAVLETVAGPEIGVASTKAFTAQLTALACFSLALAKAKGRLTPEDEAAKVQALTRLPQQAAEILENTDQLKVLAQKIAKVRDILFLGRGSLYPIAKEGALKLTELSYIHAEAYAAGELKHGPIALIDEDMIVIGLAPSGALFEKTLSNLEEVAARGAQVVVLTDAEGAREIGEKFSGKIILPTCSSFTAPILSVLPLQILAYYTALYKGTDIDQPRNLAKSVTVE